MGKRNVFTIERNIEGKGYVIELTDEELEKAFRFRDKQYMKDDAKRQLLDYFGLDINDYDEDELKSVQKVIDEKGGTFDLKELSNDDNTLEYLVEMFSEDQDCNATENDTWQNIIEDYLRETFGYRHF